MIRNFDLTQKTHILFGAGEENRVGALVKGYADSCLIVHDGGAYLEALLSRVRRSLDDAGVRYEELPGVKANPIVSKANEGVGLVRRDLGTGRRGANAVSRKNGAAGSRGKHSPR